MYEDIQQLRELGIVYQVLNQIAKFQQTRIYIDFPPQTWTDKPWGEGMKYECSYWIRVNDSNTTSGYKYETIKQRNQKILE